MLSKTVASHKVTRRQTRHSCAWSRIVCPSSLNALKHRLDVLKKLLAYSVRDQEEFLSEGVEIMNALLSLATVDEDLKHELSEVEAYNHFYENAKVLRSNFKACYIKCTFWCQKCAETLPHLN